MRNLVRWFAVLVLSLAPFMASNAARIEPVVNIENQAVARGDGKTLTEEQVKNAIVVASARQQYWSVTPVQPGMMVGKLNYKDKHTAVVDITYSTNTFSIKYRDSHNFSYEKEDGVEQIHRNYNRLLQGLRRDITAIILATRD